MDSSSLANMWNRRQTKKLVSFQSIVAELPNFVMRIKHLIILYRGLATKFMWNILIMCFTVADELEPHGGPSPGYRRVVVSGVTYKLPEVVLTFLTSTSEECHSLFHAACTDTADP